jgi:hypothetical protein
MFCIFVFINSNKCMNKIKYQTREEIKRGMRRGDYELVTLIIKREYATGTIRQQINGHRTLKPSVIDGFNKLFESREKLINA